jgi:hypothetical protein
MKIRLLFLLMSLIILSCIDVYADDEVNLKFDKFLNVTDNGRDDHVILLIKAKDWNYPVTWTLEVESNSKNIFTYTRNDSDIDRFLSNDGFVGNVCSDHSWCVCKDYLSCKKYYYSERFLDLILSNKEPSQPMDKTRSPAKELIPEVEKELGLHDIGENNLEKIAERVVSDWLAKKLLALHVPDSPVTLHGYFIYVKEINGFIVLPCGC